ncbi:MAG: GWxTD domain-containing protein [Candidatus Aminicenantes bacterium]|nr:GWxTD domain-containing protein [Candidatus Aminicenantes bacterium]
MVNKFLSAILILFIFMSTGSVIGQKTSEQDLAPQFQEFLQLTQYIMLEQEKEVFMQLVSDVERTAFVETFWKMRDPTPGTPQNEYKSEHLRRFNYANKTFGRSSVREGWRTDQGRIYIILGEPTSKERFYGTLGLYPCEVWYYYGDPSKGLPTHFGLIFYQKGGAGEFRLYDPFVDSPKELIIHSKGFSIEDFESMYERIRELAPTLSLVALSVIPGDIPYNFQPSPQNTIIMASIFESPKKDVNVSYATHFLDYKGMVSTEYMTNFIESDNHFELISDPLLGIDFIHFSMVPRSISIDYFEPKDQYFCNYQLNVSLRKGEEVIFQDSRDFPFYFSDEELKRIRGNGLAIEHAIPVIGGNYKFVALLQNSVAKEFCIFEREISVPEQVGDTRILNLMVGYQIQRYSQDLHIPFKILDKKLVIDPSQTFSSSESVNLMFSIVNLNRELWMNGDIKVIVRGMKANNPAIKTYNIDLQNYPYRDHLSITYSISASDITPDYYDMNVILMDGNGNEISQEKTSFVISSETNIFHPVARSKAFPLVNSFMYYFMLGHQYEQAEVYDKAETCYQQGYQSKPDFYPGLVDYANFLLKIGKLKDALLLAEELKAVQEMQFQYYLITGKAYMGMEQYETAIENLNQGNKLYNSDVGLLNALGFCYYKTRNLEESLKVLKASISLNATQKEVKELIDQIEKEIH